MLLSSQNGNSVPNSLIISLPNISKTITDNFNINEIWILCNYKSLYPSHIAPPMLDIIDKTIHSSIETSNKSKLHFEGVEKNWIHVFLNIINVLSMINVNSDYFILSVNTLYKHPVITDEINKFCVNDKDKCFNKIVENKCSRSFQ